MGHTRKSGRPKGRPKTIELPKLNSAAIRHMRAGDVMAFDPGTSISAAHPQPRATVDAVTIAMRAGGEIEIMTVVGVNSSMHAQKMVLVRCLKPMAPMKQRGRKRKTEENHVPNT